MTNKRERRHSGGVTALRTRLSSPGTTVQELNGDRAVVTLGPWPEAGDTEQGQLRPAYRELARVLEPWLYRKEPGRPGLEVPETTRRWERRFLDGTGLAVGRASSPEDHRSPGAFLDILVLDPR
ncbi:MAG TPA: type VI immunity family protein [Archangium sp.]|nr:type VI immunity family protein [Archangium sp.]